MEVGLPWGDDNELHHARLKKGAVDAELIPIGKSNKNPVLESRVY